MKFARVNFRRVRGVGVSSARFGKLGAKVSHGLALAVAFVFVALAAGDARADESHIGPPWERRLHPAERRADSG